MYNTNHSPKFFDLEVVQSGLVVTWPLDMLTSYCFPAPVLVSGPQGQQQYQYRLHELENCLKASKCI